MLARDSRALFRTMARSAYGTKKSDIAKIRTLREIKRRRLPEMHVFNDGLGGYVSRRKKEERQCTIMLKKIEFFSEDILSENLHTLAFKPNWKYKDRSWNLAYSVFNKDIKSILINIESYINAINPVWENDVSYISHNRVKRLKSSLVKLLDVPINKFNCDLEFYELAITALKNKKIKQLYKFDTMDVKAVALSKLIEFLIDEVCERLACWKNTIAAHYRYFLFIKKMHEVYNIKINNYTMRCLLDFPIFDIHDVDTTTIQSDLNVVFKIDKILNWLIDQNKQNGGTGASDILLVASTWGYTGHITDLLVKRFGRLRDYEFYKAEAGEDASYDDIKFYFSAIKKYCSLEDQAEAMIILS